MTVLIRPSYIQKVAKQQLTSNQIEEALNFQKVIQKIKPDLIRMNKESKVYKGIPARLVNIENKKIACDRNPDIVLDSLLHRSAARGRSTMGFEDTINL